MRRGFTLLEVLVAMSILVVIVAIVYASLAGVTDTISVARVRTEEMRLRQFLEHSLRTNLSSIYVDRRYEQQIFQFVGTNDENTAGPRDSLRFVSTNALMGGSALPGDFKEVRYEVYGGEEGRLDLGVNKEKQQQFEQSGETPDQAELEATETPLLASNAQAVDAETGNIDLTQTRASDNQNLPMYEAPSWSVPIRTFDVTYYDGTQWVDEWDSQAMGSLPWCVRVRINFARTDEEIQAEHDRNIDIVENPDFEIVVPIPLAIGQTTNGRSQSQMEEQSASAEDQAEANANANANANTNNTNSPSGANPGNADSNPLKPPLSIRGGRTRPSGRGPAGRTQRSGGSIFGRGASPSRILGGTPGGGPK